jgi:hypothetical protein
VLYPVNDARWSTTNIKVAACVAACGFKLKLDRQPVSTDIIVDQNRESVAFFFEPIIDGEAAERMKVPKTLRAEFIQMWWDAPQKYAGGVEGFETELPAMRLVLNERDWLVKVLHGQYAYEQRTGYTGQRWSTTSLHMAALIKAQGVDFLEFKRSTQPGIFVFSSEAGDIAKAALAGTDHIMNWQVAAMQNRDELARLLRHPGNIPQIELRSGDRVARFSKSLPRNERDRLVSAL